MSYDGTIYYTEVANGATSPALSSNRIRLAKVVTSGAAITSIVQSLTDTLGNPVRPDSAIYGQQSVATQHFRQAPGGNVDITAAVQTAVFSFTQKIWS